MSFVGIDQNSGTTRDAQWVADVTKRQLCLLVSDPHHSMIDVLLKSSFALGYIIGFSSQARECVAGIERAGNCEDYLQSVFACLFGDWAIAGSFVFYAESKHGERAFEVGFDAGSIALDALIRGKCVAPPQTLGL